MATPLFFQETRHYGAEDRAEIRALLMAYRRHRGRIYGRLVYPIGDKPDGASWTGFECVIGDGREGYLTLFREIGSMESGGAYGLVGVSGATVCLEDLLEGGVETVRIAGDGMCAIRMDRPGTFRFLRYTGTE